MPWLIFLLFAGLATVVTLLALLTARWLLLRGRKQPDGPQKRPWGFVLRAALVLLPLYFFLGVPGVLGLIGPGFVHTRRDEVGFDAPHVDADGNWLPAPPKIGADERGNWDGNPVEAIALRSADGTRIEAFVVPPIGGTPRAVAVLAHGLFRGGIELDPVGRMFHRADCAVVLVHLRNHGGSGRTSTTFGARESGDLLAAVGLAEERYPEVPLVVWGVSLGGASAALAAPSIQSLDGLVIDAPFDDMGSVADRYASRVFKEPMRSVLLQTLQWSGGFSFDALRPVDALSKLPADLPLLLIGAGEDDVIPVERVRDLYQVVSQRTDEASRQTTLWVEDSSGHGQVWLDEAQAYESALRRLIDAAIAHHG